MTTQNKSGLAPPTVILAGGRGLRLARGEKPLVMLAGKPLALHVAHRLTPQVAPGRLAINCNGPAALYAPLGLPLIADTVPGQQGPLAGILAGLIWAGAASPWLLTAPADTPFVPHDLVMRLAADAKTGGADIVLAASSGGLCAVCGLWSAALAPGLAQALAQGQNRVLTFVERHRWRSVMFEAESIGAHFADPFFNINTAEDLALASTLLDHGPS